jgi:hypothetical protein
MAVVSVAALMTTAVVVSEDRNEATGTKRAGSDKKIRPGGSYETNFARGSNRNSDCGWRGV